MAPSPASSKAKPKTTGKKEKLFHPQSRKAGQLERIHLRNAKLATLSTKKLKKESSQINKFVFFYHAIPPEASSMTLSQIHDVVQDVWLKRFDIELQRERSARRKGRPKSTKQMLLEELLLRETEEYRTGLEVPDLTHVPTVTLFRRWGQTDVEYLDMLRYIRISSENPERYVVSKPGKHESLMQTQEVEMENQCNPTLAEVP